jgi:hypothetical protein
MAAPFAIESRRKVAVLRFSQINITTQFLSDLRKYIKEVRYSPENYYALVITSTHAKMFNIGLDLDSVMKKGPLKGVAQLSEV